MEENRIETSEVFYRERSNFKGCSNTIKKEDIIPLFKIFTQTKMEGVIDRHLPKIDYGRRRIRR